MPTVSRKQQKAMFAAAAGHSTLGIPQSVGKEFAAADIARAHGHENGGAVTDSDGNSGIPNMSEGGPVKPSVDIGQAAAVRSQAFEPGHMPIRPAFMRPKHG
jgi:hypothetical protein